MSNHVPIRVKFLQKSKVLQLTYEDSEIAISSYFLRIHSPSAEHRGHGQTINHDALETIPIDVNITAIEPIGHYALKLYFDDGHQTGIYSWDYLYELGQKFQERQL